MDILIIGNGFDLAHGLLTRYVDFLRFCKKCIEAADCHEPAASTIINDFLTSNIWLQYFLAITPNLNDDKTWIDFENEIAIVITAFEKASFDVRIQNYFNAESESVIAVDSQDLTELNSFLRCIVKLQDKESETLPLNFAVQTKQEFVEYLYKELYSFAQMFEQYCLNEIDSVNSEYMTKNRIAELRTDIEKKTKEVAEYARKKDQCRNKFQETQKREAELKKLTFDEESQSKRLTGKPVSQHRKEWAAMSSKLQTDERDLRMAESSYKIYSESLAKSTQEYLSQRRLILKRKEFEAVLSFNYTHTFQILYGNANTKYCYIHGEARKANETNLVLGIDDRLDRNNANSNFTFAKFKKYFQRVLYKTGAEYKDWLNDNPGKHIVYIVGHSLDRTDHEVLREFFNLENGK
jgi:hypothetical protein